jgi:hypothetical protein
LENTKIFRFWGIIRSMELIFLVYLGLAISISVIAIQEDILNKKIADGYKPNAKDGDKDGIVQEGTKWERRVK